MRVCNRNMAFPGQLEFRRSLAVRIPVYFIQTILLRRRGGLLNIAAAH